MLLLKRSQLAKKIRCRKKSEVSQKQRSSWFIDFMLKPPAQNRFCRTLIFPVVRLQYRMRPLHAIITVFFIASCVVSSSFFTSRIILQYIVDNFRRDSLCPHRDEPLAPQTSIEKNFLTTTRLPIVDRSNGQNNIKYNKSKKREGKSNNNYGKLINDIGSELMPTESRSCLQWIMGKPFLFLWGGIIFFFRLSIVQRCPLGV